MTHSCLCTHCLTAVVYKKQNNTTSNPHKRETTSSSYTGFSESVSVGAGLNVTKAGAEHAALQASFEVMDTSFLLRIESSKADAGQAAG